MIERYLMGSCHHFAVAMHRLTGWDLGLVTGPYRGEQAVFHVFCLAPDGSAWDARGAHGVGDLVDEQSEGTEAWAVRLDGEAAVWRLSTGPGALLNPIHETFVQDALGVADEVLDGAATFVSDGWSPADRDAVEAARDPDTPLPEMGRDAAITPESHPLP